MFAACQVASRTGVRVGGHSVRSTLAKDFSPSHSAAGSTIVIQSDKIEEAFNQDGCLLVCIPVFLLSPLLRFLLDDPVCVCGESEGRWAFGESYRKGAVGPVVDEVGGAACQNGVGVEVEACGDSCLLQVVAQFGTGERAIEEGDFEGASVGGEAAIGVRADNTVQDIPEGEDQVFVGVQAFGIHQVGLGDEAIGQTETLDQSDHLADMVGVGMIGQKGLPSALGGQGGGAPTRLIERDRG